MTLRFWRFTAMISAVSPLALFVRVRDGFELVR